MAVLAVDLGGTKLAVAVFSESGDMLMHESVPLAHRKLTEVGELIRSQILKFRSKTEIESIGISVPGISRQRTGTVWAPNIEGWEDYPLLQEVKEIAGDIPVNIDSDRACCIMGERWQGNAGGCDDAIFIVVGTGIGAGIISGGHLIRGHGDIAGAIGWMALQKPYESKYAPCGCFEYYSSGAGIARFAEEVLAAEQLESLLRKQSSITAQHVFEAYDIDDPIAKIVIKECIGCWGMASANLVSIFNPQKVIFGGGVFGPAAKYITAIKQEAEKWAQPVSIKQVTFEHSKLGADAALFGAGYLALKNCNIHS